MVSSSTKSSAVLLAVLIPVLGFISSLNAAAGDLDSVFDGDGKVTTPIGSGTDYAKGVAIQADGKLVVTGWTNTGSGSESVVVRYRADGSLDTSFDGDGKAILSYGTSSSVDSIVVQPDGKIVIAGSTSSTLLASSIDILVARYNADGSLDTSFDGDGIVTTPIGSDSNAVSSLVLQPDGKLVVAGYARVGSNTDFAVVRYNADGSLDTSFDGDGIVTTPVGSGTDTAYGMAVQPDGKLVVVGYSVVSGTNLDFAVVRYNANGSLDTSFDGDGKATIPTPLEDVAWDVDVQSDGKIVVSGWAFVGTLTDFRLVRYAADGSLDTGFDGDGIVTTDVGGGNDAALGLVIQPNGKLLVTGYSHNGSNLDIPVVRYNPDGSLDTSFDGDGIVTTAVGNSHDRAQDALLQPDGKLVVAGISHNGSDYDFAVVRFDMSVSSSTTTTSPSTSTSPTTTTSPSSPSSTSPANSPSTTMMSSVPPAATTSTVAPNVSQGGGPGPSTVNAPTASPGTSLAVPTTSPATTTSIPGLDAGADGALTQAQAEELATVVDSQEGAAILVDGKPVEATTTRTGTSMSMSALGASLTLRCYDATGAEISMSADSRFNLSPGDVIELTVSGFRPASNIVATIYSEPVLLGEMTTDSTGAVTRRWDVPGSLSAGLHTLVASGDLAEVDDADFALRIVIDDVAFLERLASSWITRAFLVLAATLALLLPARLRRREKDSPQGQPDLVG